LKKAAKKVKAKKSGDASYSESSDEEATSKPIIKEDPQVFDLKDRLKTIEKVIKEIFELAKKQNKRAVDFNKKIEKTVDALK
jgi:hypothetical protein